MAGVDITASVRSYERVLRRLVDEKFASRLAARDASLWGPQAAAEAGERLGWIDSARASRPLLPRIAGVRDDLRHRGLDHVVLCGMGGSSLAPEMLCRAGDVDLTVLDSSHPQMVRTVLERIATAAVVVSSKSGTTVETDSQRRVIEHALRDAGRDPAEHLVIVTDPGTALDDVASEAGYTVFRADPQVGGRYSALTAFGLVPTGLAGVPLAPLLDAAAAHHDEFATDSVENLALRLGVLMAVAADNDVDKLVLVDHLGFGIGDWIEQLVAESTGKLGRGLLPVVVGPDAPEVARPPADALIISIGGETLPHCSSGFAAVIDLPLGAQLLLWEIATATAGEILQINPFDQPDVESTKKATRELLEGRTPHAEADTEADGVEVYGSTLPPKAAVDELLAQLHPEHGYLAVQAYLDRWSDAEVAELRQILAERTGRPVTFGWGPRFLHSTGQFHKGGPAQGVFLQITAATGPDLEVPDRDISFGQVIAAQAAGDAQVLRQVGRPVLRLHLPDGPVSLAQLRSLVS